MLHWKDLIKKAEKKLENQIATKEMKDKNTQELATIYFEKNHNEVMKAYHEYLKEMEYSNIESVEDGLEEFVLDYYKQL